MVLLAPQRRRERAAAPHGVAREEWWVEAVRSRAAGDIAGRPRRRSRRDLVFLACFAAAIAGCTASRPTRINDVCAIFDEKPEWYQQARDSYAKWGVPIPLQLAVIHQESRFAADDRPPRGTFLWIFPGSRPSTAYGYGQVLESTWDTYEASRGGSADRDDFGDVCDFIGWYGSVGERRYGIPKTDPYAFYLAYHEGHKGYVRGTYRNNRELLQIASDVARRTRRYELQLEECEQTLNARRKGSWLFG
jgi:hypothetical protein